MAEIVGATASLLSIIGFSAQIFDGCVKGFVLLSSARHLGRDADILRSMLDWEQYRLEQWAEQVGLHDPANADMLVDWKIIADTLKLIESLVNDSDNLKKKYNLVLANEAPPDLDKKEIEGEAEGEKESKSRFRRLFAMSDRNSTAAARVLQAKSNATQKLWWASVDKLAMKRLCEDIAYFVQKLYDCLNASVQADMRKSLQAILQQATDRYSDLPDLEFLRELAAQMRKDPPPYGEEGEDDFADKVESKFKRMLFQAIEKDDLQEVESLLDNGVDADCENHYGWSTLIKAAENGHLDVCKLLLSRGAKPMHGTIGFRMPFHFAAENGHLDCLELLLQQPGADVNYVDHNNDTAIFKAAFNKRVDVVKFLLEQDGIDVNIGTKDGFRPIHQALFNSDTAVVDMLLAEPSLDPNVLDNLFQQSPLWMATTAPIEDVRKLLIRKDMLIDKPSRFGETPLCRAARQSYNESLALFLDIGANPNARDEKGQTALMLAAAKGNEVGVELLLKHGHVDINATDNSHLTALYKAAANGHTKAAKTLIAHKDINLEVADEQGRTPLGAAALAGHKIPAKFLLKAGANINAQDTKGNTPLALATDGKHEIVVRLLLEHGADAELGDEDEETPFEKARDRKLDDIIKVFKEHVI